MLRKSVKKSNTTCKVVFDFFIEKQHTYDQINGFQK